MYYRPLLRKGHGHVKKMSCCRVTSLDNERGSGSPYPRRRDFSVVRRAALRWMNYFVLLSSEATSPPMNKIWLHRLLGNSTHLSRCKLTTVPANCQVTFDNQERKWLQLWILLCQPPLTVNPFLNWVPAALKMPEPELIEHAGLDLLCIFESIFLGLIMFLHLPMHNLNSTYVADDWKIAEATTRTINHCLEIISKDDQVEDEVSIPQPQGHDECVGAERLKNEDS
ncbi:CSC1-like protein [Tanacetum coccineum]